MSAFVPAQSGQTTFEGVTFYRDAKVFVPVKEIGFAMAWPMRSEGKKFFVNEIEVKTDKKLLDGTRLIAVRDLEQLGLKVELDTVLNEVQISAEGKFMIVKISPKRIEINKADQMLRAYQGERLVAETRVSTGKKGHTTPSGEFTAGPEKSSMRYSRKYDNSPMPWSLQIVGGVFMHGYRSVPRYPASHGCIRLPLWGANAAKWLWSWTEVGMPITIANKWVTGE
ncbi:MAG: L,D-transpeptidase family protein [Fimbriimonadaceae bacterium]